MRSDVSLFNLHFHDEVESLHIFIEFPLMKFLLPIFLLCYMSFYYHCTGVLSILLIWILSWICVVICPLFFGLPLTFLCSYEDYGVFMMFLMIFYEDIMKNSDSLNFNIVQFINYFLSWLVFIHSLSEIFAYPKIMNVFSYVYCLHFTFWSVIYLDLI